MIELKLVSADADPNAGGCGCGCSAEHSAQNRQDEGETTVSSVRTSDIVSNFIVSGMTCGHCAASVSGEVGKLDGVTSVNVDLRSGRLTITSNGPIGRDVVGAAVDEAGYALAA